MNKESEDPNDFDFHGILDQIGSPVTIVDLSGTVVYANTAARELVQGILDGEEMTNLKMVPGVKSIFNTTDDMTSLLNGNTIVRTIQIGKKNEIDLYAFAEFKILKSRDGNPEYILISAQDITPQQLVENYLLESEDKYKKILDNPFLAVIHYKDDHIIDVNSTFLDMYGYESKDEVLDKHFGDIVDYRSKMKISNTPPQERGIMDLIGVRKDGTLFPIRAVGKNITFRNENLRVVSVKDMSEPKKTEQELSMRSREVEQLNTLYSQAEGLISNNEKLVAVGRMAANIAHDLKQPLQILLSQIELYHLNRQIGQDIDYQEMYTKMLEQIQHANQVLHSLQKLAKDDLKDDYNFVITTPSTVIEQVFSLVQGDLKRHGITLEYTNHSDRELTLDTLKMSQVLMNLILNARDALSAESEPKTIIIESDISESNWVCRIMDTGPGVPQDFHSQLFKPFSTTKEPDRGTGLGLSICKGIVEGHGGTIVYRREDGKTIFEIKIPLK